MTTTRSASSSASSWSWVTKTVVWPVRVVDLAQPAAQLAAHLRVERAERLVEQQHLRLDRQRAGQRDALALAAGELARDSASPARRAARGRAVPSARRRISRLGGPRRARAAPSGRSRCSRRPSCAGTARSAGRRSRHCAPARSSARRPRRRNRCAPLVGRSSPAIRRSSVVLPEPEGPSSAISSPDLMSSETSCSAGKRSNSLRTLATRTSMQLILQ